MTIVTDGSQFEIAWGLTSAKEAGYVNDSRDPGGETNFGISKRTYPNEDILNMTASRAKTLYQRDYWFPLRLDSLNCQTISNNVFDFAIHHGVRSVAKKVQFVLAKSFGFKGPIDGIIGSMTTSFMNEIILSSLDASLDLHRKIVASRLDYYLTTAEDWEVRGFCKRANSFL